MKPVLVFFALIGLGLPRISVADSTPQPRIRAVLDSAVAVPGQVLILDVTILVPTWMLKPPEFPSFELPDVRVRLPEGASRPTMERMTGGESWAGVTRSYEISPMVVGHFRIPPQTVAVVFASPETREAIVVDVAMPEIRFEGRAPIGAESLDPFIAARELTLEQTLEGDPQDLEPGAAFTRVVTAKLVGASPIFLPPLIPALVAEGIAAYPKEPEFIEKTNRGVTTGERIERVVYVAEAGGRFRAAPIRLRWWNLGTKQIEVAEIPPIEIVSRGPPPVPSGPSLLESPANVLWLFAFVVLAGLAAAIGRLLWPRVVERRRLRRQEWRASEAFAFKRVEGALRSQRLGDTMRCLEIWSARRPRVLVADRAALLKAVEPLGAMLYGRDPTTPSKELWSTALAQLQAIRRECLASERRRLSVRVLPSLNPGPS